MRYVATKTIKPGTVLAKSIFNDKGQILLNEGVALSENLLKRLLDIGIPYVYVKTPGTEDISYNEVVPREMKTEAISSIEKTFKQMKFDSTLPNAVVIEKASQQFTSLIRKLHEQITNNGDLISLLSDVYTYDNYIFTHSFNVTLYSMATGVELGLSTKELEVLGLGAVLHDVGKMKVPTEVLFKPGKLTEEEFNEIKKHPQEGFDILRNVQTISLIVAHCAFQHHERLNGTGYPRGLKGDEIHYYAKIIAVADVFDAVTSDRVYRGAMLPHHGLEILYAGAGTLFEEKIIQAFQRAVAMYPIGITVELSDGRKGVVSKQNRYVSNRPVVRILEENGQDVSPYDVDLLTEMTVVITGCDTSFREKEK